MTKNSALQARMGRNLKVGNLSCAGVRVCQALRVNVGLEMFEQLHKNHTHRYFTTSLSEHQVHKNKLNLFSQNIFL